MRLKAVKQNKRQLTSVLRMNTTVIITTTLCSIPVIHPASSQSLQEEVRWPMCTQSQQYSNRHMEKREVEVFGKKFDFAFISEPGCLLTLDVFPELMLSWSISISGGPSADTCVPIEDAPTRSIQASWYTRLNRMTAYSASVDARPEHPIVGVRTVHSSA